MLLVVEVEPTTLEQLSGFVMIGATRTLIACPVP